MTHVKSVFNIKGFDVLFNRTYSICFLYDVMVIVTLVIKTKLHLENNNTFGY